MPKLQDHTGVAYGQLTGIRRLPHLTGKGAIWEWQCTCGSVTTAPAKQVKRGDRVSCGCVSRLENHAGRVYGQLTGLYPLPRKNGATMWQWRCTCGNEIATQGRLVKDGKTRSCGCLRKEIAAKKRYRDLTGQTFGLLTAIRPELRKKGYSTRWLFLCACGNTHVATGAYVVNGDIQSCGCLTSGSDSVQSWLEGSFRQPDATAKFYVFTLARHGGYCKPGIAIEIEKRIISAKGEYGELYDFIELPRFDAWLVEQAVLRATIMFAQYPERLEAIAWNGFSEIRKIDPAELFALALRLHGELQEHGQADFMLQHLPLTKTQRSLITTLSRQADCS